MSDMNLLDELETEYRKSGLFDSSDVPIRYKLGFPILDEQLGGVYIKTMPDGSTQTQKRLGVPAGSFTIFAGESSTGKSTAAVQAAWNIVEPFGEDAIIIHCDAEKATDYDRVLSVTGAEPEDIRKRYRIYKEKNTWENILKRIIAVCDKKEADKKRFLYDTNTVDIYGNPISYFIPTVIVIDSVFKIVSEQEDTSELSGLTSGSREAIYRGKFMRNALEYMTKYNINVIMVHHTDDDIQMMGKPNYKQLTYMITGKHLGGGKKLINYTSSIILFIPVNSKDGIKTEEEAGYNGQPIKTLVVKSRSGKGGTVALQEFVQESGFDQMLTLLNFAKERQLIVGRNPSCYFSEFPDVKFDTRIFL